MMINSYQSSIQRLSNFQTSKSCSMFWNGVTKRVELIRAGSSFEVGNGRRIQFWNDMWCSEATLATRFPHIYEVVLEKDATIAEYIEVQGGESMWKFQTRIQHRTMWSLINC